MSSLPNPSNSLARVFLPLASERQFLVCLSNGRRLGIHRVGASDGEPIFYFHGWPGSRVEAALAEKPARKMGWNLVGVDRPGYGMSSFVSRNRFESWCRDIGELADMLDWKRFSVFGLSGGSPFALACAALMGTRVIRVGILSGLDSFRNPTFGRQKNLVLKVGVGLTRTFPWLWRRVLIRYTSHLLASPNVAFGIMFLTGGSAVKRTVLHNAARKLLIRSFRTGVGGGRTRGLEEDLFLYDSVWPFRLEQIRQPVLIWHGKQDRTIPADMARDMAARLSQCSFRLFPDQGHISLPVLRLEGFLRKLKSLPA